MGEARRRRQRPPAWATARAPSPGDGSPRAPGDGSRPGGGDGYRAAQGDGCVPGSGDGSVSADRDGSPACRGDALRFAYADPPYPGTARKYYAAEATYAGEVDHRALLASLKYSYDGWALSTSARALRWILPLCPDDARVCAWVKPKGTPTATYGPHNSWEPVIVKPGRFLRPGVRDWLMAHAARGGGTLPGRKPIAFCAWLFGLLGMQPGDGLADLFPGTGVVSRAWAELGGQVVEPSPVDERHLELSLLEERRLCRWCGRDLPARARVDAQFCGQRCRQTVFRLRRRRTTDPAEAFGDAYELGPDDVSAAAAGDGSAQVLGDAGVNDASGNA